MGRLGVGVIKRGRGRGMGGHSRESKESGQAERVVR
jgi:hypothetical protein